MMERREWLGSALAAALQVKAKQAKVGCQTRSYMAPNRNRAKLLEMLDDIAAAGYEGVETNFISVEDAFLNPKPMVDELKKRKLSLIGLHMGINWNEPEKVAQGVEIFERVAAGVRDLGGSHLIVSGAAAGDALKRKCDLLNGLSIRTRELGVRLAVHNHTEEALNNWQEFRYLLANTGPHVWLLVDAGHAIMARQDPWLLLKEHSRRIAGIHLRDRTPEKPVLLGQGNLDLKGLSAAMGQTQWAGWLIVELEGYPLEGVTGAQGVRDARTRIRKEVGV